MYVQHLLRAYLIHYCKSSGVACVASGLGYVGTNAKPEKSSLIL